MTCIAVWWIAYQLDASQLVNMLVRFRTGSLIWALGCSMLCLFLTTWRWARILRDIGLNLPLRLLMAEELVGLAFSLVLPTSIGGDAARGLRLGRAIPSERRLIWASIAYERILGLIALLAIGIAGIAAYQGSFNPDALALSLLILVFSSLVLLGVPWVPVIAARLSACASLRRFDLGPTFAQFAALPILSPKGLLDAMLIGIANQVCLLLTFWLPARDLNIIDPISVTFIGIPLIMLGSVLPISLGGHGVRETLFVAVLGQLYVSPSKALALAVFWLGLNLAFAMTGVAIWLGGLGAQSREG